MNINSKNGSTGFRKLFKALPNPLFFTDKKNLFIDQWFSKMQEKFEISWDHYQINRSKLIYAKNRV